MDEDSITEEEQEEEQEEEEEKEDCERAIACQNIFARTR